MNVHGASSLQRSITIRTPENLELHYMLAGAGSRIVAYLIDFIFLWLLLNLFQNLIIGLMMPLLYVSRLSENWLMAVLGFITFLLLNTYFILFEWLMSGQTPGKKVVGIRVLKEGGYALRFIDTLIRNLMRIVDFLPLFYGVGLASMLMTGRSQRLGDLLAGTLLVHQRQVSADLALPDIASTDSTTAPLPSDRVASIPPELIALTAQFFAMLHELTPKYRQEIAGDLVDLIRQTADVGPDPHQSAESFLAGVIRQSERIAQA